MSSVPLKDAVELLYTSKDDWGGFLHSKKSSDIGELKAADLKLLKFAHSELLKEKDEHFKADAQVSLYFNMNRCPLSHIELHVLTGPGCSQGAGSETRSFSTQQICPTGAPIPDLVGPGMIDRPY